MASSGKYNVGAVSQFRILSINDPAVAGIPEAKYCSKMRFCCSVLASTPIRILTIVSPIPERISVCVLLESVLLFGRPINMMKAAPTIVILPSDANTIVRMGKSPVSSTNSSDSAPGTSGVRVSVPPKELIWSANCKLPAAAINNNSAINNPHLNNFLYAARPHGRLYKRYKNNPNKNSSAWAVYMKEVSLVVKCNAVAAVNHNR